MKKIQKIASKGFILNGKDEILLIRYKSGKYQNSKISGKFGLPGGKLDFGNDAKQGLVREVREETGIKVEPLFPFYSWSWTYEKEDSFVQIVAYTWLCNALTEKITFTRVEEKESIIEDIGWYKLAELNMDELVHDERENFIKYNEYCNSSPFMR